MGKSCNMGTAVNFDNKSYLSNSPQIFNVQSTYLSISRSIRKSVKKEQIWVFFARNFYKERNQQFFIISWVTWNNFYYQNKLNYQKYYVSVFKIGYLLLVSF